MAQATVDDPYQAQNQGLPAGSRLDSQGTGSPANRKPSPEGQKVKSLGVHVDPYGPRKDRATK